MARTPMPNPNSIANSTYPTTLTLKPGHNPNRNYYPNPTRLESNS